MALSEEQLRLMDSCPVLSAMKEEFVELFGGDSSSDSPSSNEGSGDDAPDGNVAGDNDSPGGEDTTDTETTP